jgi:hypothetical protein
MIVDAGASVSALENLRKEAAEVVVAVAVAVAVTIVSR